MKPSPPNRALKFLHWFCREDYIEEIEGDLTELYEKQYEKSPAKAKWQFVWNVMRHFHPAFIRSFKVKPPLKYSAMFRHSFLLAYRNFLRYKSSFFINLIGLSTGLACALLIYLWVSNELSVDKFHDKDDQLFQVMEHREQAGNLMTSESTSGLTAKALAEEMPEVEYAAASTATFNYTLTYENKDVKAEGRFVGESFFSMFSYGLIQGNENLVLSDKNSIVISEEIAMNLFGATESVIGKVIEWQHDKQYKVSGVFKNVPSNSSVQFDFVLSFEVFKDNNQWVTEWGNTGPRTYLLLKQDANVDQFNEKVADFISNKTNGEIKHRTLFVTPYSDTYLYGNYENGVQAGGRIAYVRLFSIIAFFILVIACINFMNLSTAKASRRIKEVGVKKAVGAGRKHLIVQYIGESILMAFLSLVTAIFLMVLFLPQFNQITGKQLALDLNLNLILALLGITAFTGLVAGSYPALYLSGFDPIAVLKGKVHKSVGEVWTRQGLVVFQFTLSIVLIVSVLVVYKQIEFVQTRNLGYDKDNIIYFKREGKLWEGGSLETFLLELKNIPGVINASSMGHDMTGREFSTRDVIWEGRGPNNKTEFEAMFVNYDMLEMLSIEMKEGRIFSRDFSSDTSKVIFNESAIEYMGLSDPLGKVVNVWEKDMEIIGIAKDFHFESLHEEIKPLFFCLAPHNTWNIMVKIEAGKEQETLAQLQQLYHDFNSGFPFDYQFLDEDYQTQYVAEQRVSTLSKYFTGLAILISCLGLFGLAAFTAERRLKEIGIRKILGSSEFGIIYLLSSDFTKMVIVSIFIALPFSYFIAKNWLESFAYRIDLEWWYFIGAGLAALLIAWFTIGLQTVKAAKMNPTECLRNE